MSEPSSKVLPLPITPLIGREQEIVSLRQLLLHPEVRLLTITGSGGIGKTRLALQIASKLQTEFLDGVLFVPLESISEPQMVVAAIAAALGLREEGRRPLLEQIEHYLLDKQFLLVLDNFEQVVEAAANLIAILQSCPETKILVTSRTLLRVQGEHEFVVPLFSLPDLQRLRHLRGGVLVALQQNAAVRLFVQRVKSALPSFELTEENVVAVAQICARLDGLPLAIELAAARIKLFSPQALLVHLNRASGQPALTMLTGGGRNLPKRQQTLRSAIEWSYRLLSDREQQLFRQLAVFAGSFSWHAAEAILAIPARDSMLDDLTSLVDKGFLQQRQVEGEPRFSLLVTIYEFAAELFEQDDQKPQVDQAHATYYVGLAEASESFLFGPQQARYLARLEQEYDNLRAVLHRAWEKHDPENGVRLVACLWRFWWLRGDTREGTQWAERAITHFHMQNGESADSKYSRLLAGALVGAGILAIYQNEYRQAMASLQEALILARARNDKPSLALAQHGLARMAMRLGQFEQAETLFVESSALFHELNNQWGIVQAMLYHGLSLWAAGKYERSNATLQEALVLSRQIEDPQSTNQAMEALAWVQIAMGELTQAQRLLESAVAMARTRQDRLLLTRGLNGLGSTLRQQGKNTAAHTVLAEAFLIAFELGDKWHVAGCLVELAQLLLHNGKTERVARIVGACAELFPNISANAPAQSRAVYQEVTARLQQQMGQQAFLAACAEGATVARRNELVDWEALVSESVAPKAAPSANPSPLTEREQEVLRWLAQGLTNMQIAERLVVSPFTINAHLRNIYNKLDVPSRPAAIRYALEHHLA